MENAKVSKAQQKAVHKYVKANYDRVELTVPKGRKTEIKAHAESHSESVNGFINRAIDETMERDSGGAAPADQTICQVSVEHSQGEPGNLMETARGVSAVSLPSDTIEAAQRAADAAGEAVVDFMRRAVDAQAKRDKNALRLGINPATGDKLEKEA